MEGARTPNVIEEPENEVKSFGVIKSYLRRNENDFASFSIRIIIVEYFHLGGNLF